MQRMTKYSDTQMEYETGKQRAKTHEIMVVDANDDDHDDDDDGSARGWW